MLAYCTAKQTHQPLPTFIHLCIHIIAQPRHYYISEDKNVPLTFSPTPLISRSLFFSSHHVTLPPHLVFCFFLFSFAIPTSVPPHLPLPLISFGLWPHLSLLIHCSVSRSIERLSVRRSHCTPHPPLPPSPPCLPRLQTHSLLGSWLSTSYTGEHLPPPPPFSPLRITFHLCTSNPMEGEKKCMAP